MDTIELMQTVKLCQCEYVMVMMKEDERELDASMNIL